MTRKVVAKTISKSEKLQSDYLKYFSQLPTAVKPNAQYSFEIVDQYDYSSKVERHSGTGSLVSN
ncbi:MAG: hypothetical protein ACOYBT_00280 [Polynucleobacter sp.]|jgi:hypothetical protein